MARCLRLENGKKIVNKYHHYFDDEFSNRSKGRMDKGGQKSGGEPKNPMTKEDAARIQSSYAKQHDGKVDRGSFPARAQAAADKRENKTDNEGGSEQSGEDTKNPMTKEDAARIQSSYAKQHDGKVDKGSFPARAQAAADKRENKSGNEGRTEQAGEDTTNTR